MDLDGKKMVLHDQHIALGARVIEFAGFAMPVWYEGQGIIAEHMAVRKGAGIFDLSHMGEIFFRGKTAYDYLQHVLCNDLRKIGNGGCQYTLLPRPEGGVVDDLLIYQINPSSYFAVVNASNIQKDYRWFVEQNEKGGFGVEIENRSDEYALIAVQGPKSEQVLTAAGFSNVHCDFPFTFRRFKFKNVRVILSATGYTGERGFELIVKADSAVWLWQELLEAGRPLDLIPVGLGARDTLRLEAGLCLYGNDLDDTTTVMEANLEWTIGWDKEFLGREALERQKQRGVKRLLFGLTVEGKSGSPRHGARVLTPTGEDAGVVTSGSFSPYLGRNIAFCYLQPELAQEGQKLQVEVRGKLAPAAATRPPFVKHRLYKP